MEDLAALETCSRSFSSLCEFEGARLVEGFGARNGFLGDGSSELSVGVGRAGLRSFRRRAEGCLGWDLRGGRDEGFAGRRVGGGGRNGELWRRVSRLFSFGASTIGCGGVMRDSVRRGRFCGREEGGVRLTLKMLWWMCLIPALL